MVTYSPLSWVHSRPASNGLRVSFRQPISEVGFVDAAWWPRSRDLVGELEDLIVALADAGRPIYQASYNPAAWDAGVPRHAQLAGHQVTISGFVEQDRLLVLLADDWRDRRIDVLVIAADTDPDVAARALLLAAASDCRSRPADILDEARDGEVPRA